MVTKRAFGLAVLLVATPWGTAVAQTWQVEDPQSWVNALSEWANDREMPKECAETVSRAQDGLDFAIASFNPADSTGGIKWCRGWDCTQGVGYAGFDDNGWTSSLLLPDRTEIRINKRFQKPGWTGLKEEASHPDVTFGVVLGHEGLHAEYILRKGVAHAMNPKQHREWAGKVNPCFAGVRHPSLVGS